MGKKQSKPSTASEVEEIAEQAECGEDVSGYFTSEHLAKQFVQVDFPLKLLHAIVLICNESKCFATNSPAICTTEEIQ
jgi:hypothetical protein